MDGRGRGGSAAVAEEEEEEAEGDGEEEEEGGGGALELLARRQRKEKRELQGEGGGRNPGSGRRIAEIVFKALQGKPVSRSELLRLCWQDTLTQDLLHPVFFQIDSLLFSRVATSKMTVAGSPKT